MADVIQLLEVLALCVVAAVVVAVLGDPFRFLGTAFEAWTDPAATPASADADADPAASADHDR